MKSFISAIVLTISAGLLAALPEGYAELEWIESTGQQYIDTGVTMTDAHGFRADYQSMTFQENGNFCGSRADATDTRCRFRSTGWP